MEWFITRIELHSATEKDYQKLHEEMERRNFSRTIPAQDGKRYRLPTATYFAQSAELNTEGVRDIAVAAANTTGRSAWVITCLMTNWAGSNLQAAT